MDKRLQSAFKYKSYIIKLIFFGAKTKSDKHLYKGFRKTGVCLFFLNKSFAQQMNSKFG